MSFKVFFTGLTIGTVVSGFVACTVINTSYTWTAYLDEATVKGAKTANLLCNSELKACTYMESKASMQAADTVINRMQASPIPVTEYNAPEAPNTIGRAPITIKKSLTSPDALLQGGMDVIKSVLPQ